MPSEFTRSPQSPLFVDILRNEIAQARNWPKIPDPKYNVRPDMIRPGWLFPVLYAAESLCWGRWFWHAKAWAGMKLPEAPIPPIEMVSQPDKHAMKMLQGALDAIPLHGTWRAWGSWSYLDYLLDWLLFAFGHIEHPPHEPEKGAYDRLYQAFCLEALIAWPHDYIGDIMAENQHGRHLGFFPTPHDLVELMVSINFSDDRGEPDSRTRTVCDPCVGTGRMLLHASNRSVCLYGQDVNPTCVKATLVNGYLYAPWLVIPFPWLNKK